MTSRKTYNEWRWPGRTKARRSRLFGPRKDYVEHYLIENAGDADDGATTRRSAEAGARRMCDTQFLPTTVRAPGRGHLVHGRLVYACWPKGEPPPRGVPKRERKRKR